MSNTQRTSHTQTQTHFHFRSLFFCVFFLSAVVFRLPFRFYGEKCIFVFVFRTIRHSRPHISRTMKSHCVVIIIVIIVIICERFLCMCAPCWNSFCAKENWTHNTTQQWNEIAMEQQAQFTNIEIANKIDVKRRRRRRPKDQSKSRREKKQQKSDNEQIHWIIFMVNSMEKVLTDKCMCVCVE